MQTGKWLSKLAISTILLSNVTYANYHFSGWYLEIEPFYAKATDTLLTNSIYAVKVPDPKIQGDFKKEYHLDLQNDWGGRIAIGYDFPRQVDTYYGMSLEYTFFDHEDSASINNNARDTKGLPVLASAEFIDITDESSAKFSTASSKLNQNYDTVDLLVAKNIAANFCTQIKIFGGMRYFHLTEHLQNHYEFIGDIGTVHVQNIYNVNFKNESETIGPHIGARVFYRVFNGFGLIGQLTGSFLYGEARSEFNNSYHLSPASPLGDPTSLTSSNHHSDSAHIIPALAGKVGIGYQGYFRNCTSVIVEAGYRGDKFFNAAHDVAYQQLLAGDDINSKCNYQDFNLSGPYFSLTIHG